MSKVEFYTNPMSRGQIVRWMLEEIGEPYDERIVQYGPEMKSADYLAINPMGKVPAIRHDGKVVTECAGICAYLADAFTEAALSPDEEERADYFRWMFFAAGPLEQAVTAKSLGWVPTDEQQRTAGFGSYDLTIETLNKALAERDYMAGERFTAADVALGSHVVWGMQFGTLPSTPAFEAYAARLKERPAFQKAKARDDALIAEMQAAEAN